MKLKYLIEGLTITDGNSLFKAFEKGMIPNLSKKKFFYNELSGEEVTTLNTLIDNIKLKKPTDFTSYLLFVLKKIGTYDNLVTNRNNLNDWLDSVTSYFKNRNKQEFKNDSEYKKKLESFENSPINILNDKKFEQFVNEKFADKAKIKDEEKEIRKIYKDDAGWEVVTPLTFAAAKKFSCMNNRKAEWCTAASDGMYKSYTKSDSLFIVKNPIKDVMFQLNFDTTPNFKNEKDASATVTEFLKSGPPEEMLKSIKNSKNETLFSKLKLNKEISDEETEIEDKWIRKEVSISILKDKIKNTNNTTIESIMNDKENFKVFEIKKGEKTFYLLDFQDKSKSRILQKQKNGLIEKSLKSLLNAKKEIIPASILKQAIDGSESIKSNIGKESKGKIDIGEGYIKANSFSDFLKYEKDAGFDELKKQIIEAGEDFNLKKFVFTLKTTSHTKAVSFKNNKLTLITKEGVLDSQFEAFRKFSRTFRRMSEDIIKHLNIPKEFADDSKFFDDKMQSGIKVSAGPAWSSKGVIWPSLIILKSLKLKDNDKNVEWKEITSNILDGKKEEVKTYKVEESLEDVKRLINIIKKYS